MKSFLLILFVFLITGFAYLNAKLVGATNAVPDPVVPCLENQVRNPEFNSLRPYQASPCGPAAKAIFCSNNYVIEEEVSTKWNPKKCPDFVCDVNPFIIGGPNGKNYSVKLSNAQFPIMGNTQLTTNSTNTADTLDDSQKLTEYLSWYLSGANQKAEYGTDTPDKTVDYSGPVKKLLPQAIADFQRFKVLHDAGVKEVYTDIDGVITKPPQVVQDPAQGLIRETFNHNQIVVCTETDKFLGIIKLPWQSTVKPVPCYDGSGKAAGEDKFRLVQWWEGKEVGLIEAYNLLPNWDGSKRWDSRVPPFPWQFTDSQLYQKAYNEWKGMECLFVLKKLVCVDIRLTGTFDWHSNTWSQLYEYIPLGNMVDKNAKHMIEGVQAHGEGGTQASVVGYDDILPGDEPVLFYPHTIDTLDITKLLNNLHRPQKVRSEMGTQVDPESCVFTEVRSNPGDDLTFDNTTPQTHMQVNHVKTEVTQVGCSNKGEINNWIADCNGILGGGTAPKCASYPSCDGAVAIVIPTSPKIPNAEQIWGATVANNDSVFRQIYPKIEPGAPVNCIADIPGTGPVTYTADSQTNLIRVETAGPNTFKGGGKGGSIDGQLYFPHIGSIYDYFLKGIQTALRPKGYGEPTPISGLGCANTVCGQLPSLPGASGSCQLGNIDSRVGNIPGNLKKIVEAAATTFKTPPNLILAVMYGEGLFNPGRFGWSDYNVNNWATCSKIPGCNESGDDNFMGFNGNDFQNIISNPSFINVYRQIDPTRTKYSQCNLMDSIFAVAWNLHDSADGGGGLPPTCYGIRLQSSVPGSCSWNNEQYESAIKIHESGYTSYCLTKPGSCATGGGLDAACPNGDTCEQVGGSGNTSHNACVWEVAH